MVVRTAGTPYAFLVTLYVAERNYPKGGEVGWSRPRPCPGVLATKLDFTQNLEETTDAITLGRRHSWLASEGFPLSAPNADVQELLATLYH